MKKKLPDSSRFFCASNYSSKMGWMVAGTVKKGPKLGSERPKTDQSARFPSKVG
jgi:hypothetical protein